MATSTEIGKQGSGQVPELAVWIQFQRSLQADAGVLLIFPEELGLTQVGISIRAARVDLDRFGVMTDGIAKVTLFEAHGAERDFRDFVSRPQSLNAPKDFAGLMKPSCISVNKARFHQQNDFFW